MARVIKGFTLIEILVVMLIMGITLTFALLAVGDFGKGHEIIASGQQLVSLLELAKQQAILAPAVLGVKFSNDGYSFYRLVVTSDQASSWQPLLANAVFRPRNLPTRTSYTLSLNQASNNATDTKLPQIMITPTGEMTPFTLQLMPLDKPPLVQITALYDGTITLKQLKQ